MAQEQLSVKVEGDEETGVLVIRIPLQPATLSASEKTLVVASTRGNKVTEATIKGKPITVGVNAYIKK